MGSAPTAAHRIPTRTRGLVYWRAKHCITESLKLFMEEEKLSFLNVRLDTKDEINEKA